jgi:hypothetical protein
MYLGVFRTTTNILRVMRIFLFGQRERRRSTRVHNRVLRGGPSHRERVAVGRRGI